MTQNRFKSAPVAYAGFSKGGAGNLRIMKTKRTFLYSESIRFPAENLVKTKKKGLSPDSVRFCAQTFYPSFQGRGHAATLHTILC